MGNDNLSIISFEGDKNNINDTLVHRSEIEDFNAKSVLIVNESQEAIFYKDGQALDLFGPGRHNLNSENLPFFKRIFAKFFGDKKTPFPCQVYFINKVHVLDILWGTPQPLTIEDPKLHIFVRVRANGQMGIQVVDSRRFLVKVVGQLNDVNRDSVKTAIKGIMMSHIKDELAKVMVTERISFLDVSVKMREMSLILTEKINVDLEEYGLKLPNFFINDISVDDDDFALLKEKKEELAMKFAELDYETAREVAMGKARAERRAAEGYSYQEERKYDVLEGAAKNEGSAGNMMGVGMGLGMGVGVGSQMGEAFGDVGKKVNEPAPQKKCPNCGEPVGPNAKFCPNCGQAIPQAKFCSNCGSKLEPGAKFCPNCGTKVEG